MIEQVTEFNENMMKDCFFLLNRRKYYDSKPFFCSSHEFEILFRQGIEKGEVYIDLDEDKLMAFVMGSLYNANGFKFFFIKFMASLYRDWVHFLQKVFLMQKETFDYVGYYQSKKDAVYLAKLQLPSDYFKIKKIKGGILNAIRTS